MAFGPLAHATANDILKEDYQPVIREQLNNTFVLLEIATQNEDDVEGLEAVVSTHQGRNRGVGARGAWATLPTAGSQTYKKSRIPLKRNYGTIKVEGYIIKMARSDRGSFTRAVESETKGIVRDLKRDVNRQTVTPANGQIAVCNGTGGSAPSTTTARVGSAAQARRLEIGYVYDIVEASTDTIVFTVELTDVNPANGDITYTTLYTGPGTPATTNRIVNTGVQPSQKLELTGLEEIVASSGTVFGIDPSQYPRWRSFVRNENGLPTDSVFERAADEVHLATGEDVDFILTSFEVARTFAATQKGKSRFSAEPLKLRGGFDAISVSTPRNVMALRPERDVEIGEAYGLTSSALVHYKASDWEWMDQDGAILYRADHQDGYEATVFRYHELATDQRNAHFRLTGLKTQS